MRAFRRILPAVVVAIGAAVWSAGPAAADASGWHLGYYAPSGRALSLGSVGADSGIASFHFTNQPNTALLVTNQGNSPVLGNDTGMTVSATFEISGATAAFIYFGEPSCGSTESFVRLFFQTSNAGGFDETHYWWSNPVHVDLANTGGDVVISESLDKPGNWSDFYGHFGNDPNYAAGFAAAEANVTSIGLSFGGGCFFENGVGTSDGSGTFTLYNFGVS